MFKILLVTLLSLTLSGTAMAFEFQTLWRETAIEFPPLWRETLGLYSHQSILISSGTVKGQYKTSSSTIAMRGNSHSLSILRHGIMAKNLAVQIGLHTLLMRSSEYPGPVNYVTNGLKLGTGLHFKLKENLDLTPMLSIYFGKSKISGDVGGSGNSTIYEFSLPLYHRVNPGFLGLRLSVHSGGSRDIKDVISISQSSAFQFEFSRTF